MSNLGDLLEEKLEQEFQEKCKKRAVYETAKELSDLRDHFAGLAMQGLLASPRLADVSFEIISADAYSAADAMLKQRSL